MSTGLMRWWRYTLEAMIALTKTRTIQIFFILNTKKKAEAIYRRVAPVEILISTGVMKPQKICGCAANPTESYPKILKIQIAGLPATNPPLPAEHR